jgi:uncharacterized phage protein (TIGR01671 family)
MREIRFRAWHKILNKIVHVDAIDFTGETIRQNDPCVVNDQDGGGCYLLDNLVLMQYTGLKDRNGTEIYEGDIVRVDPGWLYNFKHTGEIYWCDVNLGFYYKCPFHQINWDINKYFVCEVVGNNYE